MLCEAQGPALSGSFSAWCLLWPCLLLTAHREVTIFYLQPRHEQKNSGLSAVLDLNQPPPQHYCCPLRLLPHAKDSDIRYHLALAVYSQNVESQRDRSSLSTAKKTEALSSHRGKPMSQSFLFPQSCDQVWIAVWPFLASLSLHSILSLLSLPHPPLASLSFLQAP